MIQDAGQKGSTRRVHRSSNNNNNKGIRSRIRESDFGPQKEKPQWTQESREGSNNNKRGDAWSPFTRGQCHKFWSACSRALTVRPVIAHVFTPRSSPGTFVASLPITRRHVDATIFHAGALRLGRILAVGSMQHPTAAGRAAFLGGSVSRLLISALPYFRFFLLLFLKLCIRGPKVKGISWYKIVCVNRFSFSFSFSFLLNFTFWDGIVKLKIDFDFTPIYPQFYSNDFEILLQ